MSNTQKHINLILGWLLVAVAGALVAGGALALYQSFTAYVGWEVDAGRAMAAASVVLAAALGYLGYGRIRAARSPIRLREQVGNLARRS